jgi:tetratricopeptide (TPR) repeat protein
MNKQNLEKEFDMLMIEYSRSSNPEVLEKLYEVADKLVLDEKTAYHLRHLAFDRLEELERRVELNSLLQYRKAVTLLLMNKRDQALELFRKLIISDKTDSYIKDRCRGYVLKRYDLVIRSEEAVAYLKELRKTSDSTALQLLEDIEMSGQYNLEDDGEEEERIEEPIIVFTSSDRVEKKFIKKATEASFRIGNAPENYDLYLDLIQQSYFIFGKAIALSKKEVAALFTLAKQGPRCELEDLYFALYGEKYDEQKKQKDKLQQFLSRFRRNKLAPNGFIFQGTTLPGEYSYCLIYTQQYEDSLFE